MNNFYLSCKECVLEGPRSFYGCFYLGPFNNSQSLTIANALRRTLLSEISGLGILNAQIEGVEHEYSTFLGIRESVLDLLLNLKEIVFCYSSDFEIFNTISRNSNNPKTGGVHKAQYGNARSAERVMGYLQVTGPGIVRASDFKLPSFLKCVDPDQYIATLSENGKLNLKIEISEKNFSDHTKNRNFQSSFNKKKFFNNTKTLKVDSVFSPIKKVNYTIEHYGTFVAGVQFKNHTFLPTSNPLPEATRDSPKGSKAQPRGSRAQPVVRKAQGGNGLGDSPYPINEFQTKHLERMNPNNQVVFLELWTNGSIHPRVALYEALSILNATFSKLEKMKILNDVYIKSIFKSNENYSKTVKKTLSNLINLPSVSSLDKEKQVSGYALLSPMEIRECAFPKGSKAPYGCAPLPCATRKGEAHAVHLNQSKENSNSSFGKLKLIYLDKKEKNLINEFSSIKILNLPFRIENCLIQANILTLSDLFNKTLNDFKQIPGLGNQSFSFLQKKLFLFLYTCSST